MNDVRSMAVVLHNIAVIDKNEDRIDTALQRLTRSFDMAGSSNELHLAANGLTSIGFIHTGPVVAGIKGVKKFAYDIWGDTVNTASRMESSGEVGQVNISESTYAVVKDEPGLAFTARGKVQAKGKGELEMYFASYR